MYVFVEKKTINDNHSALFGVCLLFSADSIISSIRIVKSEVFLVR